MTSQTLALLSAFLEDPTRPRYGLELAARAGLKSGTLYPALARLERAGWLASTWERVDPRVEKRPRRRLYELTGKGRERADAALGAHLARLGASPLPRFGQPVPGEQPA
ncbi:MAG: PadR family transcriptional regulator [Actinomycetota bacterium]|nr:PadR family transcriptional regulator [Actinomycetota bacterium]